MHLRIDMQATIYNPGPSTIREGKMVWHLFTDMLNQYVEMIDVFPPARVTEKAERNVVALLKVPELSPGESFTPTVILALDTVARDWMVETQQVPPDVMKRHQSTFSKYQTYWETEDEGVQELVHMIAEKSNSDETYVRLAHRVVRERVKLKTHLNERRGAARALREKEGDCDEHADLLVTLARAVQIPARRVVGHYFRDEDRSEAHAWCEVLLQRYGWVPVDPALDRFGILTERYFARMREGLVSERPTILLRYNRTSSQSLRIEESVRISKQDNRLRTKRSP